VVPVRLTNSTSLNASSNPGIIIAAKSFSIFIKVPALSLTFEGEIRKSIVAELKPVFFQHCRFN
jgi:hypothetical protein